MLSELDILRPTAQKCGYLPSSQRGRAKRFRPIEPNLQVTFNALPTQAWYARASGALSFVNGATADYLRPPIRSPASVCCRYRSTMGTPIWPSCILRISPPRAGIGQNKSKRDAREMTSSAYWEPMENTVGFLRERSLSGRGVVKLGIGLA